MLYLMRKPEENACPRENRSKKAPKGAVSNEKIRKSSGTGSVIPFRRMIRHAPLQKEKAAELLKTDLPEKYTSPKASCRIKPSAARPGQKKLSQGSIPQNEARLRIARQPETESLPAQPEGRFHSEAAQTPVRHA